MTNARIDNRDMRRHGDHIGTLASAASATGDKSAAALLNAASMFMHAIADTRDAEARIEQLEDQLSDAAYSLQCALPIGQVKAIGLMEVADGVRELAAMKGAASGEDADNFFVETAQEYDEKAANAPDDAHRRTFLGLAALYRRAAWLFSAEGATIARAIEAVSALPKYGVETSPGLLGATMDPDPDADWISADGAVAAIRALASGPMPQSPAAIRRAALEEAAQLLEAKATEMEARGGITAINMARVYRGEAASIRALDEEEIKKQSTETKIIIPSKSRIPHSTCKCGHLPDKHIECVDFTSAQGCFADGCNCTAYCMSYREVILPPGWSQASPEVSDLEAPYEWHRKPPSGRWLCVRRQPSGIYSWYVLSQKPQGSSPTQVLVTAQASTPELAMDAADTAERSFTR